MRIVVKIRILGANAIPTEHPQSMETAAIYAFFRPSKRVIGPQMKDDKPIANSTPAFVKLMIVGVVLNSLEISGVAGKSDVLIEVMTSVIQLTVKRIRHFLHTGRSYKVVPCRMRFSAGGGRGTGVAVDPFRSSSSSSSFASGTTDESSIIVPSCSAPNLTSPMPTLNALESVSERSSSTRLPFPSQAWPSITPSIACNREESPDLTHVVCPDIMLDGLANLWIDFGTKRNRTV